jgi:hypothetical protein
MVSLRQAGIVPLTITLVSKKDRYIEGEPIEFDIIFANTSKVRWDVFPDPALHLPCAHSRDVAGLFFETAGTKLQRKPFVDMPITLHASDIPVLPGKETKETVALDKFLVLPPPGEYRIPYSITIACSPFDDNESHESWLPWRERLRSLPLVAKYLDPLGDDSFRIVVSHGELVLSVRPASPRKSDK